MEASKSVFQEQDEGIVSYVDATPEDARGLKTVQYKSWRATYPKYAPNITEAMVDARFADLESKIENSARRIEANGDDIKTLVAKEGGQVVGFMIAKQNSEDYPGSGKIGALYVDPASQGRGIGKELFAQGLQFLDAESNDIYLEVVKQNEPAIKFYESFGFKKSGELQASPDSITPMEEYVMHRYPSLIN